MQLPKQEIAAVFNKIISELDPNLIMQLRNVIINLNYIRNHGDIV